jgi:hypothetical protein
MEAVMIRLLRRSLAPLFAALVAVASASSAAAQTAQTAAYQMYEIIDAGHQFFGSVSGGLATAVEQAVSTYGLPNGYILGQEASGAFIAGLLYGEGTLYTKNAGEHAVYWQGPSVGADFGADGSRTMMLVYNLSSVDSIFARFGGFKGSAYLVGGVGVTVLTDGNVYLVPVVSGIGARLGVNLGYLKFTRQPTWNPF